MISTIFINGIKINVPTNITVLEACEKLNIDIPKFCYHKNLEIAGNCRMCLVEIENIAKPVASCSMPINNGMKIFTNSPKIKKARESILEFLLINHPLDCPICDQGGECDLQDQTLIFGSDQSRFFNLKRSVEDKNFGPFIKTIMTRCIHCTRCVRFANEVCNIDSLGMVGRGNKSEISFYVNKIFNSEFSANVIDLCPVGALTSKPFAFKARPWELKNLKSIDILDSSNVNILINVFNNNIVRILPQNSWISNKTRYFFDSIKYQRLNKPLLKINNKKFKEISWEKAFFIINSKIKKIDPSNQVAYIGNLIDLQSLNSIKTFFNYLGLKNINFLSYKKKLKLLNTDFSNYFLYNEIFDILQNSNFCLLINFNPKYENSKLNLLLNNSIKRNKMVVFSIGNKLDLPYKVKNLGSSEKILLQILEGKHKLCKKMITSKNPLIICNNNTVLPFYNYQNFFKLKNINYLTLESGFLNFLEIFSIYKNTFISNPKLIFYFNTYFYNDKELNKNENSFKIFQGHHFSNECQNFNLILPTLTFLEKKNLHLNLEGNIQIANKIIQNNKNIKDDKKIYKNLFFYINNKQIKSFNYLFFYLKNLKILNIKNLNFLKFNIKIHNYKLNSFLPLISNFYSSNIFEKTSKILIRSIINIKKNNFSI